MLNWEKELFGDPTAAQEQNTAGLQDSSNFPSILPSRFPADVVQTPTVGDQIKNPSSKGVLSALHSRKLTTTPCSRARFCVSPSASAEKSAPKVS